MLYYCAYTWNQGTTDEQVSQHIANVQIPEQLTVRGYYPFVGGGAGFFLVETDQPQRLREFLVPSMGVIHWDVRAVTEGDWDQEMAEAQRTTS